jgi:hypothetical protein
MRLMEMSRVCVSVAFLLQKMLGCLFEKDVSAGPVISRNFDRNRIRGAGVRSRENHSLAG